MGIPAVLSKLIPASGKRRRPIPSPLRMWAEHVARYPHAFLGVSRPTPVGAATDACLIDPSGKVLAEGIRDVAAWLVDFPANRSRLLVMFDPLLEPHSLRLADPKLRGLLHYRIEGMKQAAAAGGIFVEAPGDAYRAIGGEGDVLIGAVPNAEVMLRFVRACRQA